MSETRTDSLPRSAHALPEVSLPKELVGGELSSQISRLAAHAANESELSAPIRLPPKDTLEVMLVNITTLKDLDEARGDSNVCMAFFFAFFGAFLSLSPFALSSIQASPKGDPVENTASLMLLLLIVLFGFLWARFSKRANAKLKVLIKNGT